jgi:FixJ family two-component response regulator
MTTLRSVMPSGASSGLPGSRSRRSRRPRRCSPVGSLDQIRCLILDIHLGGLTGFDLQERLATAYPRLPIIFITALDDAPTRKRARRTGAIDYLTKPFRTEALLAAINRALDQP